MRRIIDIFYPVVKRVMPLQIYRYLACGGINWVATTLIFWASYNFVFRKEMLHVGHFVVAPHTAALGICIPFSFLVGFLLQRNVSFAGSPLRTRTQFFRYLLAALLAALVTWGLEKLLVESFHIFPTVAFTIIYLTTAAMGFVIQKYFTFRA